jgi:hypothetical protein
MSERIGGLIGKLIWSLEGKPSGGFGVQASNPRPGFANIANEDYTKEAGR